MITKQSPQSVTITAENYQNLGLSFFYGIKTLLTPVLQATEELHWRWNGVVRTRAGMPPAPFVPDDYIAQVVGHGEAGRMRIEICMQEQACETIDRYPIAQQVFEKDFLVLRRVALTMDTLGKEILWALPTRPRKLTQVPFPFIVNGKRGKANDFLCIDEERLARDEDDRDAFWVVSRVQYERLYTEAASPWREPEDLFALMMAPPPAVNPVPAEGTPLFDPVHLRSQAATWVKTMMVPLYPVPEQLLQAPSATIWTKEGSLPVADTAKFREEVLLAYDPDLNAIWPIQRSKVEGRYYHCGKTPSGSGDLWLAPEAREVVEVPSTFRTLTDGDLLYGKAGDYCVFSSSGSRWPVDGPTHRRTYTQVTYAPAVLDW